MTTQEKKAPDMLQHAEGQDQASIDAQPHTEHHSAPREHADVFAGLARRHAAAQRCEPNESGDRDPGPGTVPRRPRHEPRRRPRPPSPHLHIVLAARAGHTSPPPGTTRDELRAAWLARPDLRQAIEHMAINPNEPGAPA